MNVNNRKGSNLPFLSDFADIKAVQFFPKNFHQEKIKLKNLVMIFPVFSFVSTNKATVSPKRCLSKICFSKIKFKTGTLYETKKISGSNTSKSGKFPMIRLNGLKRFHRDSQGSSCFARNNLAENAHDYYSFLVR